MAAPRPKPVLQPLNLQIPSEQLPTQMIANDFADALKNFEISPSRIVKDKEIGQGNQGTVYIVHIDKKPGTYAMKEMIVVDKEEQRHLQNELSIMHQCSHENIVKFIGINLAESKVQIFMEYMDFGSLAELIKFKGALPEVVVKSIAVQLLDGIAYLHGGREKIVHRDLKPANVLLNSEGDVKIGDFGISRKVFGTQGEMATYVGTNLYMAPERLSGTYSYNSKCDIWSFGLILFHLGLGKFPFEEDLKKKEIKQYDYSNYLLNQMELTFPEGWSEDFKDILVKCLEKDHTKRIKASELMSHPFIVKGRKIGRPLFKAYLDVVKKGLIEQKAPKPGQKQ